MATEILSIEAKQISDKQYIVELSGGKTIAIEKDPEHNGSTWAWKIDTQIFSKEESAERYLKKLIEEKTTGLRKLDHSKQQAPEICGGGDGPACRRPGECNRMLCSNCPVAEKFFADRDGVTLVYAASPANNQ